MREKEKEMISFHVEEEENRSMNANSFGKVVEEKANNMHLHFNMLLLLFYHLIIMEIK